MSTDSDAPRPAGPRVCPHCGLLVPGDHSSCECGYVFATSAQLAGSAVSRLHDAADLFSAREALAIAFRGLQEMRGGLVRWLALVGVLQLLPLTLANPKPTTGKDLAVLLVTGILSSWVSYGMARTALAALRGEGIDFRRALLPPGTFLRILMTLMITVLPVFIGLLFFLAPGIYLMLTWSQVGFLIMDGRANHVDALRASEQLTRDRRFEILMAMGVPILLQFLAQLVQAAVPTGGTVLSPGFLVFLVATVWQMLLVTYGTWVSAVVYQMLLNQRRDPRI